MYKSFIHVERLGKEETNGLLNGICEITPKLDGTNAVIYFDNKKGYVGAGSRNRILTLESDNAGFYNWLADSNNIEALLLCEFVSHNPHIILYGEWGLGKVGSIKDYDQTAHNRFWIFDAYNLEKEQYLTYDNLHDLLEKYHITLLNCLVPRLATIINPTEEELLEIAQNNHFLLENANHPGEGIVIRNYNYRDNYGHYQIGKLVLDEFKQNKAKSKNKIDTKRIDCEENIVEQYLTESELSKTKAKIALTLGLEEFDTTNKKCIGMYLNTCYNDAILEEIKDIIKKFHKPIIDFQKLQTITFNKARKYIGLN